MKKAMTIFGAILIASFILASCGDSSTKKNKKMDKDILETLVLNDIKKDMDQKIGNGDATYSINNFNLVKLSDVEYSGVLDFDFNSQNAQMKVKVICDGDNYQYEILK